MPDELIENVIDLNSDAPVYVLLHDKMYRMYNSGYDININLKRMEMRLELFTYDV